MEFRSALIRARPPAAVASRIHAGALRELGERPERRLVHQPAAVLRRAVSAVVPDRQGRHRRLLAADRSGRSAAADRSVDGRAGRLSRRSARSAGRIRRRSRRHGHVGDLVDDAADRGGWCEDADLFARVFPMDLRPQAHDIIRTWLFSTVLRAHLEHDSLPWLHAAISGFVTDPDRKKMSKSKGNVVTPFALLEEHGSDGVRYWAAKGGPGVDTMFDAGQMKVGRRLAIKVLNASKFILAKAEPLGPVTAAVDRAMLRNLADLVRRSDAGARRIRIRPRDRSRRAGVLGLLRRLSRVRQGAALRRPGAGGGRRRPTAR